MGSYPFRHDNFIFGTVSLFLFGQHKFLIFSSMRILSFSVMCDWCQYQLHNRILGTLNKTLLWVFYQPCTLPFHYPHTIAEQYSPLFVCLCVTDPPEITIRPRNLQVRANGIAAFYCAARGDPVPNIQWRKNGKRVSSEYRALFHLIWSLLFWSLVCTDIKKR